MANQTYTVQPGDTVSAIAAKLGVPASSISGYRSGNANLIYPNEVLSVGGGSPTTPAPAPASAPVSSNAYSSSTNSTAPTLPSWDEVYAKAQSFIPAVDTSALEATGKKITEDAANSAASIRAMSPIIQNIYTNLAAQLEKSQQSDTESLQTTKTQELGKQSQSAAISGFETGSGYEAAIARAIGGDYDKQIQKVADNYGLKFESLKNEQVKDLQQLESEAQAAISKGDESLANINLNIIKIKQDQTALVRQAASDIMGASSKAVSDYYTKLYNDAMIQLKQRELDLTASKLSQGQTSFTSSDIENYAAAVLNGSIPNITGVPDKIQSAVSSIVSNNLATQATQKAYEEANGKGSSPVAFGTQLLNNPSGWMSTIAKGLGF